MEPDKDPAVDEFFGLFGDKPELTIPETPEPEPAQEPRWDLVCCDVLAIEGWRTSEIAAVLEYPPALWTDTESWWRWSQGVRG